MNAVQKKQWFFALRAVVIIIVLALGVMAHPVSAAQVRMDDGPTNGAVRGSANAAPAANMSSSSRSGEVEIYGMVESINGSTWVVGGKTITVTGGTEIKGTLRVGSQVKVHVTAGADGSLTAREIEPVLAGGSGVPTDDDRRGDDRGGSGSSGDDGDDDNRGSGKDDSDDDAGDDSNGSGSDDDADDDNSGSGSGHDDDRDED